jgi:hypothetical protein
VQAEHEALASALAAAKEEFAGFERRDIKLQVRVCVCIIIYMYVYMDV